MKLSVITALAGALQLRASPAQVCAVKDMSQYVTTDTAYTNSSNHVLIAADPPSDAAMDEKIVAFENAKEKMAEVAAEMEAAEAQLFAAINGILQVPMVTGASLGSDLEKEDKDYLVVFYAPWCPHCQTFVLHDANGDPRNAPLEVMRQELKSDTLDVVRYDVTSGGEPPAGFAVEFIPTVYFAGKDGSKTVFEGNPHEAAELTAFINAHKTA